MGYPICPKCGEECFQAGVCDCSHPDDIKVGKIEFIPKAQGWECPSCGKCHAPLVLSCDCHISRSSTKLTVGTGD